MKKVLFLCDTDNFPEGAFRFINSYNDVERVLLTGIFLHSINADLLVTAEYAHLPVNMDNHYPADVQAVRSSMQKFERKCLRNGIEFRIHEVSEENKIAEFVKETRFADLVILSEDLFFSHVSTRQPNVFMQQVLQLAECPLLMIPETFVPFNHIIAAYDGGKESMFALKKFCYLFPHFAHLPITLMYLQTRDEIPYLAYLEEFAGRHYSSLSIQKLDFASKHDFREWLGKRQDVLLIAGRNSRSGLFTALRENFADKIIRQHTVPIFIAHNT